MKTFLIKNTFIEHSVLLQFRIYICDMHRMPVAFPKSVGLLRLFASEKNSAASVVQ